MSRINEPVNLAGVRILDAVEFDLSGAGPRACAPGKTAAPVTVLLVAARKQAIFSARMRGRSGCPPR